MIWKKMLSQSIRFAAILRHDRDALSLTGA